MEHRVQTACLTLAIALAMPAWAESADMVELRQLKQTRAQLELDHAEAARACQRKFAVNDCLEQLRAQHRAQLRPLQVRENEIEAAERKARAQEQRERVRQRQQEFAADDAERRSQSLLQADLAPPRAAASSPGRSPAKAVSGAEVQRRLQRAEMAARRHAAQRLELERKLQVHQQDLARRQAQRKPVAAPLPVPTAAQIAASAAAPASGAR